LSKKLLLKRPVTYSLKVKLVRSFCSRVHPAQQMLERCSMGVFIHYNTAYCFLFMSSLK